MLEKFNYANLGERLWDDIVGLAKGGLSLVVEIFWFLIKYEASYRYLANVLYLCLHPIQILNQAMFERS